LDALKAKLLTSLHRDRGSRFSDTRSFSYDNKTFFMLEFDDLPSYQREYEDGEDKPVDKYPRLALGLVYVFDARNKTHRHHRRNARVTPANASGLRGSHRIRKPPLMLGHQK
jgi:hypothetical protein